MKERFRLGLNNNSALVAKLGVFEKARSNEVGEQLIRIDRIVVHPNYLADDNHSPHDYDVALVRVSFHSFFII